MQKENGTEYCTVFYLFNFNYRVNIYSININMKVSTVISVLCRNMLRLQHNGSGAHARSKRQLSVRTQAQYRQRRSLFYHSKIPVCIN